MVGILENNTKDRIIDISFKFFLERGYEATNIRDICKEVGIKASSLYFHYKSKQDLFFYIYDDITLGYLNRIRSIEEVKKDMPIPEKLYFLLKRKMEFYAEDISKRKFILRYHLYPPEEILKTLREKYKEFTNEENKIILDVMTSSGNKDVLKYQSITEYLIKYKRLEEHLVYEMIISNIKLSDSELRKSWKILWEDFMTV